MFTVFAVSPGHQWCVGVIGGSGSSDELSDLTHHFLNCHCGRRNRRHPLERELRLDDGHSHPVEQVFAVHGQLVPGDHTQSVEFQLRVALGRHIVHAVLVVDDLQQPGPDDLNVTGAVHVRSPEQVRRRHALFSVDSVKRTAALVDIVQRHLDPRCPVPVHDELALMVLHANADHLDRSPVGLDAVIQQSVTVRPVDGAWARWFVRVLRLLPLRTGAREPAVRAARAQFGVGRGHDAGPSS